MHRSSFHPASSTITTRSSLDSISASKSKKSEASSKSPDIVDLTSNKSSSRGSSKSTNRRHNKSPSIHGKIPPTIREGESKFHGLPVGEIDPEYYVHPNYWKNINTITEKAREPTLVKRPVLSRKLIWRGELSTFTTYKRVIAGHCRQAGAGYIVQPKFLELYEKHGEGALKHMNNTTITKEQLEFDKCWFYGMLESSIRGCYGGKQLMEYEYSQDGILAWIGILNQCDKGGNRDLRIQILEQEISTPYYKNYKGGLNAYLNNFETALTELSVVLMKSEFQSEESQKRKLLQNLEPLGWTWLDPVVHSIPMPEVYQMIRKIALKEEYMLKNKINNKGKVSQANLSHVEPDVWSKLPKDLKKLIIDTRRLEKNTSPGANKPPSTSQPSAKANIQNNLHLLMSLSIMQNLKMRIVIEKSVST